MKQSDCCNAEVNAVWDQDMGKVFYDCKQCGSACNVHGTDYETDHSHLHCWEQGEHPACGQSLESHEQCCLCKIKYVGKKK